MVNRDLTAFGSLFFFKKQCSLLTPVSNDIIWYYMLLAKMKNPVNSGVYGVLKVFDILKVEKMGLEPTTS